MVLDIETATRKYRDEEQYAAEQQRALARRAAREGVRVAVHVDERRIAARIEHNRWIADCACGAACYVSPEWQVARCFACGAVYPRVVLPAERAEIERLLLCRPDTTNRHWIPGESVADLVIDNLAHGVEV